MIKQNINGIINIYKEKGYTSHDVIAKLRGILKTRKIGHTGTLDPDAVGVLPVCIGNATKLCDFFMNGKKEYQARLLLGTVTDTQDISGKVLQESESWKNLNTEEINQSIKSFLGDYSQIPPMYSALKVNGKKLYDLARQGIEVERSPRNIHIYSIEIVSLDLPYVDFIVVCSKGTYIRTLCHDIGAKLGCDGCMESLVRNATGNFHISDSYKLSEIEMKVKDATFMESGILIETEKTLQDYALLSTKPQADFLLKNGNILILDSFQNISEFEKNLENGQCFRIHDSLDEFIAIYQYHKENHIFKVFKMFR